MIAFIITLLAALGCGVCAGVFFAFSSFVMPALSRLEPAQGIAAMQSINVAVINPWFMSVLLGTALLCLLAGGSALRGGSSPGSAVRVAGGAAYVLGTIGVTLSRNVPLNDALARLAPASAHAPQFWSSYVSTWTAWNHVRGVAALAAATLLTLGLLRSRSAVTPTV